MKESDSLTNQADAKDGEAQHAQDKIAEYDHVIQKAEQDRAFWQQDYEQKSREAADLRERALRARQQEDQEAEKQAALRKAEIAARLVIADNDQ